jgi:hypothetical protein
MHRLLEEGMLRCLSMRMDFALAASDAGRAARSDACSCAAASHAKGPDLPDKAEQRCVVT